MFDKIASVFLFEKCIYILALEMASSENQHCANCIGTLSFLIGQFDRTAHLLVLCSPVTRPSVVRCLHDAIVGATGCADRLLLRLLHINTPLDILLPHPIHTGQYNVTKRRH